MNKQNRTKDEMVANVSAFGESEKDSFSDVLQLQPPLPTLKCATGKLKLNDSILRKE